MRRKLSQSAILLWGLVLITLPVTSFRYFPFLGKSTFVRPLAFYPLALLFLVQAVRLLRREIRLPWSHALLPFGAFLLVVLLATVAGALLAPLPMRGQEYWPRAMRASLTLLIGLAFFVMAVWMHQDLGDLRHSLKWLYAGLSLTILWVAAQATAYYTPLLNKTTVAEWQLLFSVRGLTKLRRVSGFAFEPSWLAGQLAALYLPWLVASALTRFRVSKLKWLEPVLLLFTLAALALTYSRGGLFIALVAIFVTTLVAGRQAIAQAWRWLLHAPQRARGRRLQRLRDWTLRIGLILLALGMIIGATIFLANQNYVNRLWTVSADNLSDYFVKTNAGGRISYLWATAKIFGAHPWLGTGLGSSGFYIYPNLPDWSLSNIPEITKQLAPSSRAYPNPKNMYLRLLAETGVIGAALFVSFLLGILAEIRNFFSSATYKFIGVAGLFSWLAIGVYYSMQDSFAMAELWINFGIILGLSSSLPLKKKRENVDV